jgi:hypothetical protein
MRTLISAALIALAASIAATTLVSAHGDEPHPKCKKGYVVNDEHKCVKAS